MATESMLPRKVLVVGSGGREHALACRLLESPSVEQVLVCPGNAGTAMPWRAEGSKVMRNVDGSPMDVAVKEGVDLVVVGPEVPLCAGLADELRSAGISVYGPSAAASRLEGSKSFMKEFACRHGIPTARYRVVRELDAGKRALAAFDSPPVVKADGLCAGKGVVVAGTYAEAESAMAEMLSGAAFGDAGRVVVLEERLSGAEVSVHAICDGERSMLLPMVQDHKRLRDGDQGPNTGGMGTYGPASLVSSELAVRLKDQFIDPIVSGMALEGTPFCGTLFAGLMIDHRGEPSLLEINVRFGDPETQVLVNVMDGDMAAVLSAAAAGRLDPSLPIADASRHAMCVVMAADGYPGSPRLGHAIDGLANADSVPGVRVYHAGTTMRGSHVEVAGGRVLGVTGIGSSSEEARKQAYEGVARISFPGAQWRTDIGARATG